MPKGTVCSVCRAEIPRGQEAVHGLRHRDPRVEKQWEEGGQKEWLAALQRLGLRPASGR